MYLHPAKINIAEKLIFAELLRYIVDVQAIHSMLIIVFQLI